MVQLALASLDATVLAVTSYRKSHITVAVPGSRKLGGKKGRARETMREALLALVLPRFFLARFRSSPTIGSLEQANITVTYSGGLARKIPLLRCNERITGFQYYQ